ncbi:glycoside hydrolase family 38 C-terminal domain-containing protein [Naasia sp. SYSU D00948]|uniref:alpha-mannosidase n=1 Tax=Naasia sp. SYSU D00948 TaxID=2817379 RepID=UPI0027DBDEBD|nr:glycoside hydrolase family 38 C-terminal domain-containing protein [Naasia sp. SYSU D00948]
MSAPAGARPHGGAPLTSADTAAHDAAARAPIANAPAGPQPRDMAPQPRPLSTPDRTLYMIGNAHLDPVWLWPWQEGYQEARATFRSVIDRMDEYPDFVFTCDQIVLLSWVEEQDPELFARITERVAEGRWVNAGGWWVEPDCNMPMGESFARQGLYGQRYLQSRFGRHATVGMNVDPFGHNAMIPQILRGHRMDSYMFLRPGPHESVLEETLFWWQAPDGSRVLGYRIPFEYGSPPGAVDGQTDKSLGALDRTIGDAMVFYGVGNHGGGPTKANIESIYRYDRMGSFGRMQMASPRRYFDEVLARGDGFLSSLPVRRDDLQHHSPGCYSAHSGIKAWQRRAQYAVLTAERWAAVAAVQAGVPYPRTDLERAWKQVLFNQFHDILPGSAIETSYDDARDQLGEAVSIAKRITTLAHNTIARQIDIPVDPATQPVVVFNPHPWDVETDVDLQFGSKPNGAHVVDEDGRTVLSQRTQSTATTDDRSRGALVFRADVPALGYRVYRLRPGDPAPVDGSALSVTETVLENAHARIEIDPETGWLSSYLLKDSGIDVLRGTDPSTHTQICEDPTDTWGHRVLSYAWPGAAMKVERIVVREAGPLRSRVRIERSWGRSTLVEELFLDADSPYLTVQATLDWREPAHLMKLRFPVALEDPAGTYEIPYGSLERPVDGAEEPGQSWVDLTGTSGGRQAGLTVVTTNKHGYDVSPAQDGGTPSIGVTAVRSPVYSWHDPRLLSDESIYAYQDQGVQRFGYRLVPHTGDWRVAQPARMAALLGQPVRAQLESFHDGALPSAFSFLSDGGGQVMVTAVKGSEDPSDGPGGADVVVRAVETTGAPARVTLDLPLVGRALDLEFGPSQIRTFRIPADPSAAVVEVDLVEWPLTESPAGEAGTPGTPQAEPVPPGGPVDETEALTPSERLLGGPEDDLRGETR